MIPPYPKLLPDTGQHIAGRPIIPIRVSIDLRITPLSFASIELPPGESLPARAYVELFTSLGSAGIFRVRSPQDVYGGLSASAELEHAVVEVGDYLVLARYSEMMSAQTAMSTIFSHYRGSKWQLGNISALGSGEIAVEADHDRVLQAMLSLMEQKPDCMMQFDFSTTPWTINIVAKDTTVTAEGRLSRNMANARIIYDDTELCTKVYYEKPSVNASTQEPESVWASLEDAAAMATYGLIEKEVFTGSNWTEDEAQRVASLYLAKHKTPRISIEISAEELSDITGESYDTFTVGKLFRLALPDYNIVVDKTITAVSWQDVYQKPHAINITLDEEEDTVLTFLHDVDAKGGSGGGGGGAKKADDIWKEYRTDIQKTDYSIDLYAVRVDRAENILQQAGMYIDSNGVLQYAADNENMVMSHLQVQANRINLVVEGSGDNAHIKPASIVAAINAQTGQSVVKLSADVIDIDGLLQAQQFQAALASIDTIAGDMDIYGSVTIGGLTDVGALAIDGDRVGWRLKTVVTGVVASPTPRYFIYSGGLNDVTPEGSVLGRLIVSVSTETITYLGEEVSGQNEG